MEIAALIICFAIDAFIFVRNRRREHAPDENFLIDELCNEARTKYPSMELSDALDMLYRDYYDKLIIAREKREDVVSLIESRRLIAQERAFLLVREQQLENTFELVHSAQA
jgi:hypothetical protein